MRSKFRPQSTFQKLSTAFLLIGVLPLILVYLLFIRRFEVTTRATMEQNMEEANYYAQTKVGDLIEDVDRAAEVLYDFSSGTYGALYEILESKDLNSNERQMYIGLMLDQLLQSHSAVSAAHFLTPEGETFTRFYSQQKSLRASLADHHCLPGGDSSRLRQLFILPAAEESQWCSGSSDTVLTLARNYMDTRSLRAVTTVSLGTLYIDIRTEALDGLLASIPLGEGGNAAIVDSATGQVLYRLHGENTVPLLQDLGSGEGSFSDEEYCVYHAPIGSSNYQLVVSFDLQELYSTHSATRTYLFLILAVAAALVLLLGLFFSGHISTPTRQLQKAMREVQEGNLDTRVDIHSGDEMEYLGEGFNQMVSELSDTIQAIYVAQICQRDAELNALKMQIQPHYLYNTLDVIRMSALEQGDRKTARLIEGLSHQLRYVMGTHRERVPLRQELDSLQEYAVLMNVRYEGRIRISIEAANTDLDLLVPKLLLQPFVENAIKHGLRDKPGGGTILIEAARMDGCLHLRVFNDGIPIPPDRLEHIRRFLETSEVGQADETGIVSVGMKNTYDRIKLNCGQEYGFTLDSSEGMGAVVNIRLPVWREEDPHVESASGG